LVTISPDYSLAEAQKLVQERYPNVKFSLSDGYWKWHEGDASKEFIRGAALFDTLEHAMEHFLHLAGQTFPDHEEA
jgi:hypothetical protein